MEEITNTHDAEVALAFAVRHLIKSGIRFTSALSLFRATYTDQALRLYGCSHSNTARKLGISTNTLRRNLGKR